MGSVLTKSQYETLAAIARQRPGSWEVINTTDAHYCVERGFLRFEGKRYHLTEAGRLLLREWQGCECKPATCSAVGLARAHTS